jgi:hypothetical protein
MGGHMQQEWINFPVSAKPDQKINGFPAFQPDSGGFIRVNAMKIPANASTST